MLESLPNVLCSKFQMQKRGKIFTAEHCIQPPRSAGGQCAVCFMTHTPSIHPNRSAALPSPTCADFVLTSEASNIGAVCRGTSSLPLPGPRLSLHCLQGGPLSTTTPALGLKALGLDARPPEAAPPPLACPLGLPAPAAVSSEDGDEDSSSPYPGR